MKYWQHVILGTRCSWMHGDRRGFRDRGHRIHSSGDYKNPPPAGEYDRLHERSRELMKRDAVHLTIEQRQRAVEEMVRSFAKWKIELKTLGIDEILGGGRCWQQQHHGARSEQHHEQ